MIRLALLTLLLLWFSANIVDSSPVTTILAADNTVSAYLISDAILAYKLQQPDVVLSVTTSSSTTNENLLFANQVDFAITSTGLTAQQMSLHPTVEIYPFMAAALVPVYRLDALGTAAPPITFSRDVLARIFLANITRWNDPALVASNPSLTLPNQSITIVYESDATSVNIVFTNALCSFYTPACTAVPSSSLPAWPLANYSAYASGSGISGLASTVTTIDGSIGYAVLAAALQAQATVGSIINRAGRNVVASSTSVTFALAELATQDNVGGDINLNDGSGPSAWPICAMSYLIIDTVFVRDTCAIRAATVDFWLFIFQSTVVTKLANSRQYAMLPDIVLSELNIDDALTVEILCNNAPAVKQVNTAQVAIAGSSRLSFLLGLLTNLYSRTDTTVDYVYNPTTSQIAFDQLVAGEVDVGIYFDGEVTANSLGEATDSGDILIIPTFLVAITPVFNPQITPTVNLGTTQLILDYTTFVRMFLYNVTTWRDPDILALNPNLASLLGNDPAPLTLIIGCGSGAELISNLYAAGVIYATQYDPQLLQTIYDVIDNATIMNDFYNCIDQPREKVTPNEFTVPSVVNALTGAVGYKQDNSADNIGEFILIAKRGSGGQSAQTTSAAANQLKCLSDTFNPNTLTADLAASQNLECWPYTTIVYTAVRTSYLSDSLSSTGCTLGLKALRYVSWLNNNGGLDIATTAQNVMRTGNQANVQSAINAALNQVTCDGKTLLITLPDIWTLASGASGFGMAIAVVGLIGVLAALTVIVIYHSHPIMKSASVWFLFTSTAGVGLLFVSLILLVSTVTSSTCAAFSWTVNLGFMFTFGPLFAKTWRIYRIFGRKKLSVVKVSNFKLAFIVAMLVLADIILLSIWQSVSPVAPMLTVVTSGSPPVDHDYTQCSVSGAGMTFLIIEVVCKGALLLYGALLAFSTRRVSDNFNESQSIAWAIYNVVFSVGIVTPIIIFIGATGDILILLMTFVMGWIAYFTGLILIVPKFIVIFSQNSEHLALNTTGNKSSVDGFDFISVDNFDNSVLLRGYINALNQQITYAKQRLTSLTRSSVADCAVVTPEKIVTAPINRQVSDANSKTSALSSSTENSRNKARAPPRVQHGDRARESLVKLSLVPSRLAQSLDASIPGAVLNLNTIANIVNNNTRLSNSGSADEAKAPLVVPVNASVNE